MYFQNRGIENTARTIELAAAAARERGIGHIVVASNTGETARLLLNAGLTVVCVTHAYGFRERGKNEMSDEARGQLQRAGVRVVTASHVFSGVERGISSEGRGMYPAEIIAGALRMLGQGVKVCAEIATMALDAGQIPCGEKIVAIGGTVRGADTAVVMTPAHAAEILKTGIHEIICKPL